MVKRKYSKRSVRRRGSGVSLGSVLLFMLLLGLFTFVFIGVLQGAIPNPIDPSPTPSPTATPTSSPSGGVTVFSADFKDGIDDWYLSVKDSTATLNVFTDYAELTSTSYDSSGWIGALHDLTGLKTTSKYEVTFDYKATTWFNFQFMSSIDQEYVVCPASDSWASGTLSVSNIQSLLNARVQFNLYSVGTVQFDNVVVTELPSTSPTPAPTTSPVFSGTNLAAISSGLWTGVNTPMEIRDGVIYVPAGFTSFKTWSKNIAELNTCWTPNGAMQASGIVPLKAGDHVVMIVTAKIGNMPDGYVSSRGFDFGFDAYSGYDRLWECHYLGDDVVLQGAYFDKISYDSMVYLPWGSDWTTMRMEVVVPDKIFTTDDHGAPVTPARFIGFIPWMGSNWRDLPQTEGNTVAVPSPAEIYVKDVQIYINP